MLGSIIALVLLLENTQKDLEIKDNDECDCSFIWDCVLIKPPYAVNNGN